MAKPWEIPDLHPGMHLDTAARHVILARFEQMASYRDAVLEDTDIENLHDMRVCSRRLRAAWRSFGTLFPGKRIVRFQREARDITRTLGTVRDLDVMLESLEKAERRAPGELLDGFDSFYGYIGSIRAGEFELLTRALQKWHPNQFIEFFDQAESDPFAHAVLFEEQAHVVLSALAHEFLSHQPCLTDPTASEEQHVMRIAGKRLRYAIEIFASCLSNTGQLLHILKTVQEDLGTLHDCDVMVESLNYRQRVCLTLERPTILWLIEYYRNRRETTYGNLVTSWHKAVDEGFSNLLLAL